MQTSAKVIKSTVTVFLLQLLLTIGAQSQDTAVALQYATSSDPQLNITSSTDDYVAQNQRQYFANIDNMDALLAALKASYELALSTITTQKELLSAKLQEIDNKLYPLQWLDDRSKHCVQKYRENITSSASVQLSINNCVTAALNNYYSYVSSATSTRNILNNYYNINLLNALKQCKKSHSNPSLNYTICALQAISQADSTTALNLKNFNTQLQAARCSADSRIKLAVDCSYTIVHNTVSVAGEMTRLIDNCAKGLEFCSASVPKTCPNEITLALNSSDFRNATINNPFYGLSGNGSCVLINFSHVIQ